MTNCSGPSLARLPLIISALLGAVSAAGHRSKCDLKGKPAGKILVGYWENVYSITSGARPDVGSLPINEPEIQQHGYKVITAAYPVVKEDGTVLWQDGMAHEIVVPTPEDICEAKAGGATVLLSIGGAVKLSSKAVADTFIATVVPILKKYHFDGIDIAIKEGLISGGSMSSLSVSQRNLIRIIDSILAQMGSRFGLTLAPEVIHVTGAKVRYSDIWGAYLLVIKNYVENERLWWLNMQYYNGTLFGCTNDTYAAGDVRGFIAVTDCLARGITPRGITSEKVRVQVPYELQVPGLPSQVGAARGYLSANVVRTLWSQYGSDWKGLMAWSINWDASMGWTFGENVRKMMREDKRGADGIPSM